jgi:hypothetical protein
MSSVITLMPILTYPTCAPHNYRAPLHGILGEYGTNLVQGTYIVTLFPGYEVEEHLDRVGQHMFDFNFCAMSLWDTPA